MSHFTRVQTKLYCLTTLRKAAKALGYKFAEGRSQVRGFNSQRCHADLVIDTGCGYDIGFAQREDGYEVIADWDFVERRTGLTPETFLPPLKQKYSYFKVLEQVESAGYTVVEERAAEGDGVTLRVRRWGS